jgi:hypothetical protein
MLLKTTEYYIMSDMWMIYLSYISTESEFSKSRYLKYTAKTEQNNQVVFYDILTEKINNHFNLEIYRKATNDH